MRDHRDIKVSRQFYAQLAEYLDMDERFTTLIDDHLALVVFTPYGKQLNFSPLVSPLTADGLLANEQNPAHEVSTPVWSGSIPEKDKG